jgi:hypothetical protein
MLTQILPKNPNGRGNVPTRVYTCMHKTNSKVRHSNRVGGRWLDSSDSGPLGGGGVVGWGGGAVVRTIMNMCSIMASNYLVS